MNTQRNVCLLGMAGLSALLLGTALAGTASAQTLTPAQRVARAHAITAAQEQVKREKNPAIARRMRIANAERFTLRRPGGPMRSHNTARDRRAEAITAAQEQVRREKNPAIARQMRLDNAHRFTVRQPVKKH